MIIGEKHLSISGGNLLDAFDELYPNHLFTIQDYWYIEMVSFNVKLPVLLGLANSFKKKNKNFSAKSFCYYARVTAKGNQLVEPSSQWFFEDYNNQYDCIYNWILDGYPREGFRSITKVCRIYDTDTINEAMANLKEYRSPNLLLNKCKEIQLRKDKRSFEVAELYRKSEGNKIYHNKETNILKAMTRKAEWDESTKNDDYWNEFEKMVRL